MIGVTYTVDGQVIGEPHQPVQTPFVTVDLRIGWWHLARALIRRQPLDVRVIVDADPDTHKAVQDLLDAHPTGDTLFDAAAQLKTARARVRAARRHMDRMLDAATTETSKTG